MSDTVSACPPSQSSSNFDFRRERMTRRDAAEYLGLSESSLAQFARTGAHAIPFVRLGRKIYYVRCQLDRWLAARGAMPSVE